MPDIDPLTQIVKNCTFQGNEKDGFLIKFDADTPIIIENCLFEGNKEDESCPTS